MKRSFSTDDKVDPDAEDDPEIMAGGSNSAIGGEADDAAADLGLDAALPDAAREPNPTCESPSAARAEAGASSGARRAPPGPTGSAQGPSDMKPQPVTTGLSSTKKISVEGGVVRAAPRMAPNRARRSSSDAA